MVLYEWLGGQADIAPGKFSNIPFGVNFLIFPLQREGIARIQPFIIVGGGGAEERTQGGIIPGSFNAFGLPLSTSGQNKLGWMANAGAGALYPITDNVSLRVDGGYRWQENNAPSRTFASRNNGNLGFWVVNAGRADCPRAEAATPGASTGLRGTAPAAAPATTACTTAAEACTEAV